MVKTNAKGINISGCQEKYLSVTPEEYFTEVSENPTRTILHGENEVFQSNRN
jgi:hypothetical protein